MLGGPDRHLALTGLRGPLALVVLASHGLPLENGAGGLAVIAFFALSGFLLVGQLLDTPRDRPGALAGFYIRRSARILPLYLAVVGLIVAVFGAAPVALVPPLVGLVTGAEDRPGVLAPAWSVGVEECAYLVLPLLAWGPRRPRAVLGALLVGVVVSLAVRRWTLDSLGPLASYHLPLGRVGEVLWGGVAAWAVRHRPAVARRWAVAGGAASCVVLGIVIDGGHPWARMEVAATFYSLALAGLVIGLAERRWPLVDRLLSAGPCVWLGTRSYALYLTHTLVATALASGLAWASPYPGAPHVGGWAWTALVLAGTCVASALTWPAERGIIRWARGWSERRRAAPGLAIWRAA